MEAKRKIHVDELNKNKIKFTILIQTEGELKESLAEVDFSEQKVLTEIEKELNNYIFELTTHTIEKVRDEYQTDVLDLGEYLRQNHFQTWQKLKDNWDSGKNYFAQCEIEVKVEHYIRNTGVKK